MSPNFWLLKSDWTHFKFRNKWRYNRFNNVFIKDHAAMFKNLMDDFHRDAQALANCVGGTEVLLDFLAALRNKKGSVFLAKNNAVEFNNISLSWERNFTEHDLKLMAFFFHCESKGMSKDEYENDLSDQDKKILREFKQTSFSVTPQKPYFGFEARAAQSDDRGISPWFSILFLHPLFVISQALVHRVKDRRLSDLMLDRDFDGIVDYLVRNPASANGEYCCPYPLCDAAELGEFKIAEALVKHGSDPNQANFHRVPSLHLAIRRNHFEIARMLLDQGANPDKGDFQFNLKNKDFEMLDKKQYDFLVKEIRDARPITDPMILKIIA